MVGDLLGRHSWGQSIAGMPWVEGRGAVKNLARHRTIPTADRDHAQTVPRLRNTFRDQPPLQRGPGTWGQILIPFSKWVGGRVWETLGKPGQARKC